MKFQIYRLRLALFVGIVMFFTFISQSTFAQESTTFSGRVVDEAGNPVVGVSVAIGSYTLKRSGTRSEFLTLLERQTDLQGSFSITNIPPGSIRLALSKDDTKITVLSVEIDDLIFYPNNYPPFTEMRFSLDPKTKIENAVIKIKTNIRPQIRARVVSADGKPIVDAQILYKLLHRDLNATGRGYSSDHGRTDAEGYFVEKLRVDDEPQFYMIGIEYNGYFAKAAPFILHEGQPLVHLLLRLNENPIPEKERTRERVYGELTALLEPPPVWAINPANGHAYKKISCHSIEDAIVKATAENAYLVSINDKAEEQWIKKIFGKVSFWIGLSDVAEEGKWVWHSGEPVTYTNWDDRGRSTGNTEMKDFVTVDDFTGRWRAVEPGKRRARPVNKVILEREELPDEKN